MPGAGTFVGATQHDVLTQPFTGYLGINFTAAPETTSTPTH